MQNSFPSILIDSTEIARLIEENLSAKSMDFAKWPGGKSYLGNPAWFQSGLKRAGYNGVTCARFNPKELDQEIENCLEPFRQSNIPLTWWVGPLSEPVNLGRALQEHGFRHIRDMVGMAANLESLKKFTPPDLEYTFETVLEASDLEDWLPLFMETFGVPIDDKHLMLEVFGQLSFPPGSQWRHYYMKVNGQVVATSSLHLGGGVAGLYNIATQYTYRQQGLGTAITLLTFEQARQMGLTWGTLQTTYPNALRLYHRLGLEVFCKIGVYQRQTW